MLKPGNKAYSILNLKCPKCHQGDLFCHSAYGFRDFTKMPDRCEVCGQKFMIEPGFWYGAMYFAYAFGVAISLPLFLALYIMLDTSFNMAILYILLIQIIFAPLTFRYSRAVWINIFVNYDESKLGS